MHKKAVFRTFLFCKFAKPCMFFGGNYIIFREDQPKGAPMKKILSTVGTIAALTLLSGCAKTMQLDDPALYDQYLTRSYNQPVGKCFYAVQATFAEKGVELTKVDTERGRIVTERYVVAVVASYGYNTGTVSSLSNRYYFDVTGNEKTCTIKVTKYKAWNGNDEATWIKPDDAYAYYWEPLFRSIQGHLNDDEEDELADKRSAKSIDVVVKQRTTDLQKIYNQYKEDKPGFGGKVTLKFTIDPKGDVISMSIAASTTNDSNFDEIIKMAVSTWNFGRVAKGNTTVTIPFTFSE